MNTDDFIREIKLSSTYETKFIVLIGENGVGKSTILSQIAHSFSGSEQYDTVIAISNTPHDKFSAPAANIKYLGQREGNKYASKAIKQSFSNPANKIKKRMSLFADVLEEIGYRRKIGFKLQNFNCLTPIADGTKHKEDIQSLVEKIANLHNDHNEDPIIWIDIDHHNESITGASIPPRLIKHEETLINNKVLDRVAVVLQKQTNKQNENIDFELASSGEISYLSSMAWATANISKKSIILIDEPENSLHPRWQVRYINNLYRFFEYYEPLVIIATHCPMLLSGEESSFYDVVTYRVKPDRSFERIGTEGEGIEGISWEAFNVIPRQNQFVAGVAIDILNRLSSNEIDNGTALDALEKIVNACTDEEQKAVIRVYISMLGVINLG